MLNLETLLLRKDLASGLDDRPSDVAQELLPFTVRIADNPQDLEKAVKIRHRAYARHLPEFAQTLRDPEPEDEEKGAVVLLASSKLDGSPLGTMRIQTNEFKPLCLERSITLPEWLGSRKLAEATRLGVADGKGGRLITHVLFKAFYLYCLKTSVEWMVIAARAPMDREYARLLFNDVFHSMEYVPLKHAHNLPHRIMSSQVQTAETRWALAKHPLFEFAFLTLHPDIQIGLHRNNRHCHDRRVAPITRQVGEQRRRMDRRALRNHCVAPGFFVKHLPEVH